MPETIESERMKMTVLRRIGDQQSPARAYGPSNYTIGRNKIHARFCRTNIRATYLFKFNINPNTLRSDYELWICGQESCYYLLPSDLMREIYEHPDTYPDRRHPEIRVVSVNVSEDNILYRPGGKLAIAQYRNAMLPDKSEAI